MNSYDLAIEAIQEGRIHTKLKTMIDYIEQLNQKDYDDCTC